jgi:phosphoglycerate kinase
MAVKTVRDIDLNGKTIIMRADFNVPLKGSEITDDTRIQAALPTIRYILEQKGTKLILMSHLGRPKGERKAEMSLAPVAAKLSTLLSTDVTMAPDCIGEEVESIVSSMKAGDVVLLENLRFHNEEKNNDEGFAKQLASLADVYVNDAFGTAHRAHASTEGITHHLPAVSGFLIEKEVKFFAPLLANPAKPFVAIIGGAKVSTKIEVLKTLIPKCTTVVIGGGMSYTFLKVKGHTIGKSLLEEDFLDTAKDLITLAQDNDVQIILPVDHVIASEFSEDAEPEQLDAVDIPEGKIGMDIGPATLQQIQEAVNGAKSLVWNGPVGVFEFDSFSTGTLELAKMVAECSGTTVIGGGDSVAAVNKFGLADKIDHVSTGGGASLEFLEGKTLPGIAALQTK